MPSLAQLNDAVMAYMAENPNDLITVVVDATFGHRIDAAEVPEFEAAIENNEIVSPPAGAIGRGDAFVLTIANKANAIILSNDSFQEFHPDYPWLFDEGRLVGGKPVPHVGWVFVSRSPVRGLVSRRATKAKKAKERGGVARPAPKASPLALQPMPVPKSPPPRGPKPVAEVAAAPVADAPAAPARGRRGGKAASAKVVDPAVEPAKPSHTDAAKPSPASPMVNELMPFLDFVERFPVGAVVEATIESYSSHGAYASAGPARLYIPMRLMASPSPRSAREVVKLGETRSFVVVSFNPSRRGIDVGIAGVAGVPDAVAPVKKAAKKAAPKVEAATTAATVAPVKDAPSKKTAPKKAAPKNAAAKKAGPVEKPATPARKPAVPKTAKAAPTKAAAPVEKAPVKKVAAKTAAPANKAAPAAKAAPADKVAPAKTAPAKAAPAKTAPAKTAGSKKATPQKVAPKKAAPATKAAPAPKAAPAEKAAPDPKAAPAKKTAAPKKAAPAKKAPVAKRS